MRGPKHPEAALLDFQWETAPLVFLAEHLEEASEIPDEVRALCLAVQKVHRKAEEALEHSVGWASGPPYRMRNRVPSNSAP